MQHSSDSQAALVPAAGIGARAPRFVETCTSAGESIKNGTQWKIEQERRVIPVGMVSLNITDFTGIVLLWRFTIGARSLYVIVSFVLLKAKIFKWWRKILWIFLR